MAAVALLTVSGTVYAAQTPPVDPKAQAVIDSMVAAYKKLNSLHEKIAVSTTSSGAAVVQTGDIPQVIEIKAQRPNRLFVDRTALKNGKQVHEILVCDGTYVWRWNSTTNRYTKTKAPSSFSEIGALPSDSPDMDMMLKGANPLADLKMGSAALPITLGPPTKSGGVDIDLLEAKMAADGAPLSGSIRFLVGHADHVMHEMVFEGSGKDPASGKDAAFRLDLTYPLIDMDAPFTPHDFRFVPPAGAKLAGSPAPVAGKKGSKQNAAHGTQRHGKQS